MLLTEWAIFYAMGSAADSDDYETASWLTAVIKLFIDLKDYAYQWYQYFVVKSHMKTLLVI